MPRELSRRDFLATAAGATAAGAALTAGLAACARAAPGGAAAAPGAASLPRGAVVLFQGDSITDVGRGRNRTEANGSIALGGGYPQLVAAALLRAGPERGLRFYNRGISGNRVPDLAARWDEDALALKPDLVSVLIGVNDFSHVLSGRYAGTAADYESGYAALLERTRAALPAVRLVVLEPFALRAGSVDDRWFPAFDERRAIAARVAQRAGATFVPLQRTFDELAARSGAAHWIADGVHPTPAGHAVLAERWRAAVGL